MPLREMEIIIRGRPGTGAYNAAHAVARVLGAEGAFVDLRAPVTRAELADDALHGVRTLIQVEEAGVSRKVEVAETAADESTDPGFNMAQIIKIGIGGILLLMLVGAEVKLRFGVRLGMIVTILAMWAFGRFALRPRQAP